MDLNKIKNKSYNSYSQVLFFIGWVIIILGVIGSIVLGKTFTTHYGDFNFAVFLIGVILTAMSGFVIIGLAEVISILNDNRRLLATMTLNTEIAAESSVSIESSIAQELPEL